MLRREQSFPSKRAGEDLIHAEAVKGKVRGELGFERGRSRHSRDTGPGPGAQDQTCTGRRGEHRRKDSELILEAKGEQTTGSNEITKRSGTHGWARGGGSPRSL